MPGDSSPPWLRYAGMGLELAGTVAVLTLLGWWIDGRYGTAPWGVLAGAVLGMAGGMTILVRDAMSATHPKAARRAETPAGTGDGERPPGEGP